jgi:hypothetical protein
VNVEAWRNSSILAVESDQEMAQSDDRSDRLRQGLGTVLVPDAGCGRMAD